MKKFAFLFLPLFLFLALGPAQFQTQLFPEAVAAEEPAKFTRSHRVETVDGILRYTATAEEIFIRDDKGEPTASFFIVTYALDGVANPDTRPVTFIYNGGPGAGSLWLHIGLVGPKTIDIPSDAGDPGAPPYAMKTNPYTLLRATDLVFVDPVGTGFSEAKGEKKNEDFWGFEADADSVAEFIRLWVTQKGRWNSPKYLMGESYGGLRTGLLIPRLQQDLGLALNGVILVAPALDMGTLPFFIGPGSLTYVTQLPSYAATAYYYDKLAEKPADFDAFLAEVEEFASTEYLTALFRGNTLSAAEKDRIAGRLAAYTGLSRDYILDANLRIFVEKFRKELKRDEDTVVGRLDSRYTQHEPDPTNSFPLNDPFIVKTGPIYTSLFNDYLQKDFGVDLTREYKGLNIRANQAWKRPGNANSAFAGFVDVTGNYLQGTLDNSDFRIFAAAGYYDLVTTYYAIRTTFQLSGIDPGRLTLKNYQGGHMMYLYQPAFQELSNDIVAFIRGQ